ncbi:MAG: SdiA-regulated domain-containing protein [Myxococcota bacterium]
MSEPERTQAAEPQPVDWAFLIPMTVLFVAGSSGVVYGKFRDARVVAEAELKQEALRQEIASKPSVDAPYEIPYDLEKPDWFRLLPLELNEVSGFAVNEAGDGGWAVNDEIGSLYPFALVEGLVGKPFEFAGRGDYEGVEIVGNEVVVARSDGKLLRVRKGKVKEVESPLDYENDVEGLALDGARSRLLVACKGRAGKGKAFKRSRGIYALSLPEYEWDEVPAYVVTFSDLKKFIKDVDVPGLKGSAAKDFAPSAIAVSPDDQYIYILSSVGRMLVVLDIAGDIVAVAALPRNVHRQPEGLAFDAQGSMYVSNEGRDRAGSLFRFDPIDDDRADDDDGEMGWNQSAARGRETSRP